MKFLNQKNLIYFTLLIVPLYLIHFKIFSFPINFLDLLLFINVLVWLQNKKKTSATTALPWRLTVSIGLILFGTIASIFSNDSIPTGLGILKSWFILPLLFSYILYNILENETDIEKVFLAIYSSASFVAFVSFFYKVFGLVTFDSRLSAFYQSPNYLAMYLAPGVLLGFYFLNHFFKKNHSKWVKIFFTVSFILILSALFFTYSYGAWLAVFVSMIFVSFFRVSGKQLTVTLVFTLTLLVVFFAFQINSQKFSNLIHFSERSSLSSRLMIWQVGRKLLWDNPIWGIGPGNFQNKYLSLQYLFPPYLEWAVPQPHNLFLAFWLQSGIFGLIGFLFLLFSVFYDLLRKIFNDPIRMALLSLFVYTFLHGLIDTPFWKNDLALLFWVFIALNFKTLNQPK
jgi:O-antigen ligase